MFRSDYEDNKRFPHQLVDADKRLRVGAGINTHDYRDRVPALLDAGVDALCFDSSDGYSDWQAEALTWVKRHYPEVPTGGGNVVDREAFTFLAEAGADFVSGPQLAAIRPGRPGAGLRGGRRRLRALRR